MSSNKTKARSTMYKLLANKMGLDMSKTHISMFDIAQCKKAISILKPMYISIYGEDLKNKRSKKGYMYYSNMTFSFNVFVKFNNNVVKSFYLTTTIYCKNKYLNEYNQVCDLNETENMLRKSIENKCMNELLDTDYPSLELLAKYIYEQVVYCYKVKIINTKKDEVIFEEEKD